MTGKIIFYCFIEDTRTDFIEYFDSKEEAFNYIHGCINFMKEKQIKYSRARLYNKENPMEDIPF